MVQTTLELTNSAIAASERGADWRAVQAAEAYVLHLAEAKVEFTTDKVLDHLEEIGYSMKETRFIGSVMQKACKKGLIRQTDEYRKSYRKECHMRPKAVWVGR